VTWQWDLGHCHSVTTTLVPKRAKEFTTYGGKPGGPLGVPPATQVQLVKPAGDRNTFTVKLTVPGTYQYQCVHHASVGMTGTVIVTK
jgi:plastocyanin